MDEMKFVIALTVLFLWTSIVYGDDDDDVAEMACMELFNPVYVEEMCCENMKGFVKFDDELEQCKTTGSSEESTCEDFECILNKQGMLEGGKINNDKAKVFFDGIAKDNPKEKNIIDAVKRECLDGQYEEYVPDEVCVALKFYVCVYTNAMVECDLWKDTKTCKEASDYAKKCKEAK